MMPSSSTIHPHHRPFNNNTNMVPYSNNNPMPMPTTATMVYYGTPHHPQHHPHHPRHHPQAGPQAGPQQAGPPQAYHLFRNHQHPPQGPYYYSPTTVVVPGPTGVMPLPNVMYIQPTTHPAYAASHNGNGNGNGNGAFHYGPIPNGNYGSAMMMILPTNNNSAPTTTTPPIKAGASHPTNRAPATTASAPSPIKSRPSKQQPKRGAPVASLLMSPSSIHAASSSTNQAEAPSPIKSGPSLKSKSRSKSKEEAPTTPPRSRSTSPENVASHYRTPTKHVVRTGDANRGNVDDDDDDGHGCGQSQPSKSNKRPRLAPRPRLVSPNQTTSSSKTAAPNKNRTVPKDGGTTTTTVPSIPEVGISGGTSEEKVASTSKLAPIPKPANDDNHQPSVPPIEPSPEVYHCMKNVKWKIRKVLPPAPQLRLQSAAFLAALSRCDYCWSIQGKRTSCTCVQTSLRDKPHMISYLIRLKVVVERMRVRSPAMFDHYVKLLMKEHAGDVLRGFFPFPRLPKEDDGDDDDDDDYDYDGSSSSSSSKKDDLERLLPDFANRRICKGLWRKIVGVPKSKFEEFERMVFYSNARSSRALSSRSSSLAVASEEGGGGGTLNGEDIRYLLNCVGLPTSNNDEEEDGADDDDNVDNGGSAASFKGLFGDDGSSVSTRSACTGVGSHISTLSQFSFARYM